MKNELTHTPTPWGIWLGKQICPEPEPGTFKGPNISIVDNPANAAFIVRAVNSHAALVDALKAVEAFWDAPPSGPGMDVARKRLLAEIRDRNRAALKLADGKE